MGGRASRQQAGKPVFILGTNLFAEEVADLARQTPGYEVAGFVVNLEKPAPGESFEGKPVYWIDDLKDMVDDHEAICSIGTTQRRQFTDAVESIGMRFATLVHPSAQVLPSATLGQGTIVSANAVIASHTTIGNHVIINRAALVGHHTSIGNHVTIGPGANVAGACRVGDQSYIAMSAVIIDRMTVGTLSVVGAGAVVTKPVPDRVQVLGVPAKIVKEQIQGK